MKPWELGAIVVLEPDSVATAIRECAEEIARLNAKLTTANERAYARGYQAGKRRVKREISRERQQKERQAFLDRIFIAAVAECVSTQGWKTDDKPITDVPGRVKLARDFALEALKQRPFTPYWP